MRFILFRSHSDKEDMLRKAKQMERFAAEFVDCIENCEDEEYYDEDMKYNERDEMYDERMNQRNGAQYRRYRMNGRYSYNR